MNAFHLVLGLAATVYGGLGLHYRRDIAAAENLALGVRLIDEATRQSGVRWSQGFVAAVSAVLVVLGVVTLFVGILGD